MRSSILVTGGAGYIGSHTAKALSTAGFQPVVIDDLSSGHSSSVRWGPFVQGDFADQVLVQRTIAKYEIEAVIHFAARAYVGESMTKPRAYYENNVIKSQVFLDTLLDCGVNELIFSSSCAVYGIPETNVITEAHPRVPINPYGDTKLYFEKACQWYSTAYQIRTVSLRYFNAAGADSDGELGEEHTPETHLIPLAIQAALGLRRELSLFGTTFETPDGTAVRDFVHVDDVAAAHVDALSYLREGGRSIELNLGSGQGTSVRRVIQEVEKVAGIRVPVRECDPRPGDPPMLVASAELAKQLFGWTPKRSDIENIIGSAWTWEHSQAGQRALASAQ